MWACECGRRFRTEERAEQATTDGCPKCGSFNIDVLRRQFPSVHEADIDSRELVAAARFARNLDLDFVSSGS